MHLVLLLQFSMLMKMKIPLSVHRLQGGGAKDDSRHEPALKFFLTEPFCQRPSETLSLTTLVSKSSASPQWVTETCQRIAPALNFFDLCTEFSLWMSIWCSNSFWQNHSVSDRQKHFLWQQLSASHQKVLSESQRCLSELQARTPIKARLATCATTQRFVSFDYELGWAQMRLHARAHWVSLGLLSTRSCWKYSWYS